MTDAPAQATAVVPEKMAGMRLDQALAMLFADYSRSRLQAWNREGKVWVDGHQIPSRSRLLGGEQVVVELSPEPDERWQAEVIELVIPYQDDSILIIDKPAGMVVHPAVGNRSGTLVNGLLHHVPELATLPRAGIVHRLDKETSGLLVVARTLPAHAALVSQLQQRTVSREYQAVISGRLTGGGTVDEPIGRHPVDRKRMAVKTNGKRAITHYRLVQRFANHSHIRVILETGRTHQIRVHMAHLRHSLVGDPLYGGRLRIAAGCSEGLGNTLRTFRRQALHAAKLGLRHPASGEQMSWQSPLPDDMEGLLEALQETSLENSRGA